MAGRGIIRTEVAVRMLRFICDIFGSVEAQGYPSVHTVNRIKITECICP